MADTFSYKIPTESELFTFDFTQVLAPGETISTASCTILVMNGVDPNANDMLAGAPVIIDAASSQRVIAGLSEVSYRLIMTITTSQLNTYVGVGDFLVLNADLV
jgi:hypothetical protein